MDKIFTNRIQVIEAQLRGLYISISCDIEYALVDITCMCLISNAQERKTVNLILFDQMTFAKKNKSAEVALKHYNPDYYKKYEDCFRKFDQLNKLRNKFAHSRINGDPNRKNPDILYFEYLKDGKEHTDIENKKVLLDKLDEYRKAVMKFIELITLLYHERASSKE